MSAAMHPCCLTIAGSDSGGNAGVQADLRAFHAYGLHGCTVFAALTAQNPFGVSAIHPVPADFVAAQLDAVLGVYSIRGLKTGMLSDPAAIEAIADRLEGRPDIANVVDPVMIATSGARLVSEAAMEAVKARLLPVATLMTPNLPEAEVLLGGEMRPDAQRAGDAAHAADLALRLRDRFGCAVVVKGGHGAGAAAVDVLATEDGVREFSAIAIIGSGDLPAFPCGVCRQVMSEFCDGDFVLTVSNRDGSEIVTETLDQMMPHRFGPKDLL